MENLGGLGVALHYINYGNFDGRTSKGSRSGDYGANTLGMGLGWGIKLGHRVLGGIGLQAGQLNLADRGYTSLASNVGVLWRLSPHIKLGVTYTNLGLLLGGPSLKTSSLWLGASTQLDGKIYDLLLASSIKIDPLIGTTQIHLGVEDTLYSFFILMAGYQIGMLNNDLQGVQGVTVGFGFLLQDLSLDYAYLPFGDLGISHRLSVGYFFGKVPISVEPDARALAEQQEKEGNLAQAAVMYQEIINKNDKDYHAWLDLGKLYIKTKDKEEAIQCLEKVLQLQPDYPNLKNWLQDYKKNPIDTPLK
jgi:hypothetical protein